MGIKDLLGWAKKAHPEVTQRFPLRWAAPEFKGKRVAIDATLMTNRYHFASKDGPFIGKGEILGWYNLISEMRAYGVKPVAIWDERGFRDWKSPEALRRLTTRANHLARRNREIERMARLKSLKEVLSGFQAMPREEQDIVRAHWETTRFMFLRPKEEEDTITEDWEGSESEESISDIFPPSPPTPESLPPPPRAAVEDAISSLEEGLPTPPPTPPPLPEGIKEPSKSAQLTSTLSEADGEVIERVVSMIDSLAPLVQEYRESQRPTRKESEDLSLSLGLGNEGLVEMEEELREWVPSKPKSISQIEEVEEEAEEREEKVEVLNQALEELLPSIEVGESPRQKWLSKEEGEIISSILSSPPSPPFKRVKEIHPTPPSTPSAAPSSETATAIEQDQEIIEIVEEEYPEIQPDPMERLDQLIHIDAPNVKRSHDKALDMPTAADHEDCKELLRIMGVPVLEAKIPYEAEGLACALAKNGLVDYVGTEDSDVLAYEGPLLKHLSPITSDLALISGTNLRALTGLSKTSYLDFLILLGTDASPRIPTIGPINAFKQIQKHGSIENILDAKENSKVVEKLESGISKEKFLELVGNARRVFTELPPVEQWVTGQGMKELDGLEWDEGEVERFLEDRHGIKLV